jgi:hypothetical protein
MHRFKSLLIVTVLLGFSISLNSSGEAKTMYIKKAPPGEKIVIKTSRPFPNAIWISSRWKWTGTKYVWLKGYWIKPRHGYIWVDGYWVKTKRGWFWKKSHWKPI